MSETTLEPLTIVTYGAPKTGKTSDLLFSFPKAVFLAPNKACFASSRRLCGYEPARKGVVNNLDAVLVKAKQYAADPSVEALIVDDLALIADQSIRDWDGASRNSYEKWNRLRDTQAELFDIARNAPWHLVCDSHEMGQKELDGTLSQGGPKLTSLNAGQDLAKSASLLLHAVVDTNSGIDLPWPVVYRNDRSDSNWAVGDRTHVAPKVSPMNLGEILRVAGYEISRHHPWQEDLVERGSELYAAKGREIAFAAAARAVKEKHKGDSLAIRWTLRDIYARAYLREAVLKSQLEGYIEESA